MCLADPACAEAYPDLVTTLNGVFSDLADTSLITKGGFPIAAEDLERLILSSANLAGGQWRVRYLPRMIHDLAKGDTEVYEALFSLAYAERELAPPDAFSITDMSYDVRPLLNRANSLAEQARALAETAEALARQAQSMAAETDDTPAARFLRTLNQLEDGPISTTLDSAYTADRTALPTLAASIEGLSVFIDRHFNGADAEILMSSIQTLEPEDITEIYRRMRNEDRFTNSFLELGFAWRLFNCSDSVPFNSAEAAFDRLSSYQIPGLTNREGRMMAYELGACGDLPTGTLPPSFHDPVTGDGSVPVLVFTGTNDIQTATSWAEQAADARISSQFVRFPNTWHGATLFSHCARDVAAAFFDQPTTSVNAVCKSDLIPGFVLPDERLP